jgi:predicted ATPase
MLIKRLSLKKILSFNDATIELGRLNVLIGPNAVGKSNLIEVISLLQAAPTNLATAISRGGGARQWLWLGDKERPTATLECHPVLPRVRAAGQLEYRLQFTEDATGLAIVSEQLAKLRTRGKFFERTSSNVRFSAGASKGQSATVPPGESVLSQFKNPADTTPITEVGNAFSQIRIFREFRTGVAVRFGASTSLPKEALLDGGDNLALVLLELDFLGVHERIRDYLKRFCERFEDVKVNVGDGLARTYLREAGLTEMLPAIRMSDGTLKFLSLLAALFHPKAPPLMCIEEPELGLHPDALQLVAEALVEASEKTQLIVTTHSDALVDALTDRPESILVCERDFDNGTQMQRLSKDHLKLWLERYTLGQLWRKGEIGGGRW